MMNWDQIKHNWPQVTREIHSTWGKLSPEDLVTIAGRRKQLAEFLQKRYGYEKEVAEKKVDDFAQKLQTPV